MEIDLGKLDIFTLYQIMDFQLVWKLGIIKYRYRIRIDPRLLKEFGDLGIDDLIRCGGNRISITPRLNIKT
jgi:hypothetical protein